MLVAAVAALSSYCTLILMLIIEMMRLVSVSLPLKALVHIHLVALVTRTSVEQAMVLPMTAVVVHPEVVASGRVRAGRSIWRRRVGVLLE